MRKIVLLMCFFILILIAGCTAKFEPIEVERNEIIWVIEPTYNEAYEYASGLAYIVQNDGKNAFIDKQGEIILNNDFIYENESTYAIPTFRYGVFFPENEKAYPYVLTRYGKKVPYEWSSIAVQHVSSSSSLSVAKELKSGSESYGYVNQQSIWYIQPSYYFASDFNNDISIASDNNGEYFIYANGEIRKSLNKLTMMWGNQDTLIILTLNGMFFADFEGNDLFGTVFDEAKPYSEGYAAVCKDGLWGYINSNGGWLVEPKYSEAYSFSSGLALVVNKKGKSGFIDTNGNLVIHFQGEYAFMNSFDNGLCIKSSIFRKEGVVDKNDKWIISPQYDDIYIYDNYVLLKKGDKYYIYIRSAKKLIKEPFIYVYEENEELLLATSHSGDYAISTVTGEKTDKVFYIKEGFSERMFVATDGATMKTGYINKDGQWIVPPIFDNALPFSEGVAAVQQDGKWGYISNPLIYDKWMLNEYERGLSLGLYQDNTDDKLRISEAIQIAEDFAINTGLTIPSNLSCPKETELLTRESAVYIVSQIIEHNGINTLLFLAFLPDEDIDELMLGAVNWAASYGLLDSYDGYFLPKTLLSEQEYKVLLTRVFESILIDDYLNP